MMEKYILNPEWMRVKAARISEQFHIEAFRLIEMAEMVGLMSKDEEDILQMLAARLRLNDLEVAISDAIAALRVAERKAVLDILEAARKGTRCENCS
jgi:archaellum biogenesis ATPase FlaH